MIKLTAITSEEEPHSTIAAFLISPTRECDVVHAGDSRIYHFRGAEMVSRTIDHSYVQRLVDEAPDHRGRGQHPPAVEPADRLPRHVPGSAAVAAATSTGSRSATACWPAATACGTTSRRRELGAIVHALPPREASEMLVGKARQRARGAATTCRSRWSASSRSAEPARASARRRRRRHRQRRRRRSPSAAAPPARATSRRCSLGLALPRFELARLRSSRSARSARSRSAPASCAGRFDRRAGRSAAAAPARRSAPRSSRLGSSGRGSRGAGADAARAAALLLAPRVVGGLGGELGAALGGALRAASPRRARCWRARKRVERLAALAPRHRRRRT